MFKISRALLLALTAVIAACGGGRDAPLDSRAATASEAATRGADARVVVAVLDSGINAYHAFYHAGGPLYQDAPPSAVTPAVLQEFGIDERHILRLTRSGIFQDDFEADRDLWSRVVPGQLYWIAGTNIIASSFADPSIGPVVLPNDEGNTHGTGTSAAVLQANPEAIVLFIEVDSLGSVASHELGFTHPGVDFISTSYGVSIAAPGVGSTGIPQPEVSNFRFSFEAALSHGKMHFSSGGNGPGLTPLRAGAGPWWSVGVSGIEEGDSEGRTLLSGVFPDFISDFTQELPYCADCEDGYRSVGGTSFSTPRAAGVASRVLLEARRAAGHQGGIVEVDGAPLMVASNGVFISSWQLRRALEEAAWVPPIGDYDPATGVTDLVGLPINPVAPWLQAGWGDLSADPEKGVVAEALAQLGFGQPERVKGLGFCEFQTAIIDARHLYWDNLAASSDSFGNAPAQDPFEYCGAN